MLITPLHFSVHNVGGMVVMSVSSIIYCAYVASWLLFAILFDASLPSLLLVLKCWLLLLLIIPQFAYVIFLGVLMHPIRLTLDEKPLTVIISNDKMLNINHATRYCRCIVQFRCSEI